MRPRSSVQEIRLLPLSEWSYSYINLSVVGSLLVIYFCCRIGTEEVYFMTVYFVYLSPLGLFGFTVKQTTKIYLTDNES